uniref:Uncharacterized protein n=1 Tax=Arundo donax TaxID=35708 RepID=A0A0A9B082_ARUDO
MSREKWTAIQNSKV